MRLAALTTVLLVMPVVLLGCGGDDCKQFDCHGAASIGRPADGATVSGTFEVEVAVVDSDSLTVIFKPISGQEIKREFTWNLPKAWRRATMSFDSTAVPDGTLEIKALAGSAGHTISVTVDNAAAPVPPPTVTIVTPEDGAIIWEPTTIRVDTAAAPGYLIEKMDIRLKNEWGTTRTRTHTNSPPTATWSKTQPFDPSAWNEFPVEIQATVYQNSVSNPTGTHSITVMVAHQPPTDEDPRIEILRPRNGDEVHGTIDINVGAHSGGPGLLVESISIDVDGNSETYPNPRVSRTWFPMLQFDTRTVDDGLQTITATVTQNSATHPTATHSIDVTVVNTAPTVTINAPGDGATVSRGFTLDVSGTTYNGAGNLEVEIGTPPGNLTRRSQSVSGTWQVDSRRLANGPHTITATLTDDLQRQATATINITAANLPPPDPRPQVTIQAPSDGDMVWGTIDINVDGESGGPGLLVESISIDVGGNSVTYPNSPPSATWSTTRQFDTTTVSDGPLTIGATVRQNSLTRPTATDTINVRVANTPGPTIAINEPLDGNTVSGTFLVNVIGNAPAGLDKVEVTIGTLSGLANSLPALIYLDSTQLNDETWYELKAKATDVNGKTDEAKIDVYVNNSIIGHLKGTADSLLAFVNLGCTQLPGKWCDLIARATDVNGRGDRATRRRG